MTALHIPGLINIMLGSFCPFVTFSTMKMTGCDAARVLNRNKKLLITILKLNRGREERESELCVVEGFI